MDSHPEPKAEDLGARVRAVRELAGANPRDVAKAAGMSRRELEAVERGAKRLTDDELRAIARALRVKPDVLVGVGFEGDLVRAPSTPIRIDRPDGDGRWDDRPEQRDDLAGETPIELPHSERRRDYDTRNRIEQSWRDVRAEMGDALTSCARLVSAGSGDDVRRLIERLERDLTALKAKRPFQRNLADHERSLERARSGGRAPLSSITAVGERS